MKSTANFVLALALALLVVVAIKTEARPQEFTLFWSSNCVGANTTYTPGSYFSSRDVRSMSADGLWYFRGSGFFGWKYGKQHNSCQNLNQGAVSQIRHVGADDLDTPTFALFSSPRFEGTQTYVNGTELTFPRHYVYSWGFTGKRNWTVYAEEEWAGAATCLVADPWEETTVTYEYYGGMWAGSVRRGCEPGVKVLRGTRFANNEIVLMAEETID